MLIRTRNDALSLVDHTGNTGWKASPSMPCAAERGDRASFRVRSEPPANRSHSLSCRDNRMESDAKHLTPSGASRAAVRGWLRFITPPSCRLLRSLSRSSWLAGHVVIVASPVVVSDGRYFSDSIPNTATMKRLRCVIDKDLRLSHLPQGIGFALVAVFLFYFQ